MQSAGLGSPALAVALLVALGWTDCFAEAVVPVPPALALAVEVTVDPLESEGPVAAIGGSEDTGTWEPDPLEFVLHPPTSATAQTIPSKTR